MVLAARTICLPDPTPAANARRRSTAWSVRPKSTGLDPEAYLRHVLDRIADHPVNRIAGLLPRNIDLAETSEAPPTPRPQ
jgi:hypothetical protein